MERCLFSLAPSLFSLSPRLMGLCLFQLSMSSHNLLGEKKILWWSLMSFSSRSNMPRLHSTVELRFNARLLSLLVQCLSRSSEQGRSSEWPHHTFWAVTVSDTSEALGLNSVGCCVHRDQKSTAQGSIGGGAGSTGLTTGLCSRGAPWWEEDAGKCSVTWKAWPESLALMRSPAPGKRFDQWAWVLWE